MSTPTETPTEATPSFRARAAPRVPLRERVLGLRAVAAVGLASLVIGGAGGAVLGAVSNGGDPTGPGGGPLQHVQPGQQFQPGQPGQVPGQVPPGTAPQQDVRPDDGGETTSGTNT